MIEKFKVKQLNRVDFEMPHWLNEYARTANYGLENIRLAGVKELLDKLQKEKEQYTNAVKGIAEAECSIEAQKYQKYEKWTKLRKMFGIALIVAIVLSFVVSEKVFGFKLVNNISIFAFGIGPIIFIVCAIGAFISKQQYNHYAFELQTRLDEMGRSFLRQTCGFYDKIDSLYLSSLDPVHREMVLTRREQQRHNEEMMRMEKERYQLEKARYNEQQRATAATQQLLEIERERERRYRGW